MSPPRVYLDQNVYGHLLDRGDWRAHPLAQVLIDAQIKRRAEVWLSPTHVMELALASDQSRRQHLAEILVDLSCARRMTAGSDMALVKHFGLFINDAVPGPFDPEPFLDPYTATARSLWLGNLALLACGRPIELGPAVAVVRRLKLESQLIHARICAKPDETIAAIVEMIANFTTTGDPDPLGLSDRSDSEIQAELAELRALQARPSRATITALKKNRADLCVAYGAVDIGGALEAVFSQYPLYLVPTFDVVAVVAGWNGVQEKYGARSLPAGVSAAVLERRANFGEVIKVLNALIRTAAVADMPVATGRYYCLIRELEVCLNRKEAPTAGAALDVDHVTAALCFDIAVCHDGLLADNLKAFVAKLPGGVQVVANARQLERAIARGALVQ